jgi:hypothetical protein
MTAQKGSLLAHFLVDVLLYATEQGGRREPIAREGFSCPCKLQKESNSIVDCRLILKGQQIAPGETKRVGIRFPSDAQAEIFRSAGKFYFWDGRIIGEAFVVPA